MDPARARIRLVPEDDPLLGVAARGVRIEGTPLGRMLVLTCEGDLEALRALSRSAGPDHALRRAPEEGGAVTVVVEAPLAFERVRACLAGEGATLLPPVRWDEKGVVLDVLAPDPAALVEALGASARLLSVAPVRSGGLPALGPLPAPPLTARQVEALSTALEAGYYDAPRRATAGEVAARMGIGRSTFEEHLRTAEGAAIRFLAPILRLGALDEPAGDEGARADALETYARFSTQLGLYVEMGLREGKVARLRLREAAPVDAESHPHLDALVAHLATGEGDLSLIPLEPSSSEFRRAVHAALREIPPGRTATYAEIAARIGRPGAARAVGTACAKNPTLLLVPCHRVLPASGRVGAYAGAGGATTKALLLDLERARAQAASDEDAPPRASK